MELFQITGEFIELNKLLKACGLCSTGGEAKMRIQEGEVNVDGMPELRVRCKLRKGQVVEVQDQQIQIQ